MITNPIPEPLRALLGLYETELRELKFPDIDAQVLAQSGRAVLSAAEEVAEAEAALDAARAELQRHQEALLHKGQRALAYARVFAEEQPELLEKLAQITLPRPPRRAAVDAQAGVASGDGDAAAAAPKRRGRPPKVRPEGAANLFAPTGPPGPEAVEADEERFSSGPVARAG